MYAARAQGELEMWQDPIVAETRALREKYAKQFNNDRVKILADIARMKLVSVIALIALAGCTATTGGSFDVIKSTELRDPSRERQIPITLYFPAPQRNCTDARPCPVAFVSPGYGLLQTDYSFISKALVRSGYLVVAIQHELPTDPALSKTGDLFTNRMPMWKRGVENIRFVKETLSRTYAAYDWPQLVLVGGSNGGDISALALHDSPKLATTLVTLDNRRYPLPRSDSIKVLSIRGSDFEADAGVLPTAQEKAASTCVTTIAGSRHNDMSDHGSAELQSKINTLILQFLKDGRCRA